MKLEYKQMERSSLHVALELSHGTFQNILLWITNEVIHNTAMLGMSRPKISWIFTVGLDCEIIVVKK